MNLPQNKIMGSRFAVMGVKQELFNKDFAYVPAEMELVYEVNQETMDDWELPGDFFEDFLKQLKEIGPIEMFRHALGLEPMQGYKDSGFTLRHKSLEGVMAHVRVASGPIIDVHLDPSRKYTATGNPNTYAYPVDMILYFYFDVDRLADFDGRDVEDELKIMKALTHQGMGRYGFKEEPTPQEMPQGFVEEDVELKGLYESLTEMNSVNYKGFQIDDETEAPGRFVIYDPALGDYLEHEPIHSVKDAKKLVDKIIKNPKKYGAVA